MLYEIYRMPETDALEIIDIMRADAIKKKKEQKINELKNRKNYEQDQQRRISVRNHGHGMRHYGNIGKRDQYRACNR